MPLLEGRRLAVMDVETTGFDPLDGHTILEVARVTLEDGRIVDEWSSLVGPRRPIAADAVRVHGIHEAMLEGAPEPPEVARAIIASIEGLPLVFHNAMFDLPFIAAMLRGCGLPPIGNPVIDTLGLARGLFGSGSNSLGSLASRLALPTETAHRALGDARTTARVLMALAPRWEQERGVGSLAELAAASLDSVRLTARRAPPRRPPAPVAI
jgi:DNA polymerase III epsilon subunit family exonuclease